MFQMLRILGICEKPEFLWLQCVCAMCLSIDVIILIVVHILTKLLAIKVN